MIYTAIFLRESYVDNSSGYVDGYTDSDVQVYTFTRVSDLRNFVVPFLVGSRLKSDENRALSYHEVSILVNGIPGSGLSFSGDINYAEGLESSGAAEEATQLEKEIEELYREEYIKAYGIRVKNANDARLAEERLKREVLEKQERNTYESLRRKFEGA